MLSSAFEDGFVLAATIQEDRKLVHAGPGLAPGLARVLGERLAEFDGRTRPERHRIVRSIAEKLSAVPEDVELPPRAARLLDRKLPVTGEAPPGPALRASFRPTPGLRRTLRRLATSTAGPADVDEEREAAETLDALPPERQKTLRALAREHEDPVRALGALVLGMEGRMGGDEASRRLRRTGRELALVWGSPWRA